MVANPEIYKNSNEGVLFNITMQRREAEYSGISAFHNRSLPGGELNT
jgi:hypothetical protein